MGTLTGDVIIKLRYRKVLRLPLSMYRAMLKQESFGYTPDCFLCQEAKDDDGEIGCCAKCRVPAYPDGKEKSDYSSFSCICWVRDILGPLHNHFISENTELIKKVMKERRIK